MPEPPCRAIALAGPTASGKTAAALAIAARHDSEIISVDSALVYRGMDIGTAKPSPAERAAVPHHLIDIRDPVRAYSAAEFVADARDLIARINARGRLALLVGGTMLYFKALFEGLDALPAADPAVRAELDAQAALHGWPGCTPNWRAWTRSPPPGWGPTTASGSSGRWRCSASRDSPCPACILLK